MQVTLADLLAEIRNLSYLFYGYTVIWVIVLFYAFTLSRRERSLRKEIEELKKGVEEEPGGPETAGPKNGQSSTVRDRTYTTSARKLGS